MKSLIISTLFLAHDVQAGDLYAGVNAVVYSTADYCPYVTGQTWTSLQNGNTGNYYGRVIVSSSTSIGGLWGSALTSDSYPTHSHWGWQMSTVFTNGAGMALSSSGDPDVADYNNPSYVNPDGNNYVNSDGGSLPYVPLLLCRYDSGPALRVPTGTVVFYNGGCPGGWSPYGWYGRVFVFAASWVNPVASPTPGISVGSNIGPHSHYVNPTSSPTNYRSCCWWAACGCCSSWRANYVGTAYFNTNANTDTQGYNIPYINLQPCYTTADSTASINPDSSLAFYQAYPTCAPANMPGWRELTTAIPTGPTIAGRIVVNAYNYVLPLRNARGGGQLKYAMNNGAWYAQDTHYHSMTFGDHGFNYAGWSANILDHGSCHFEQRDLGHGFSGSTQSDNADRLSYLGLRGCMPPLPTRSPTHQPSRHPSSSAPSKNPTTSYPTLDPTRNPTYSKPSHHPTHKPSRNPTSSKPSRSPSTSKPSRSPTTSIPTLSPSFNPTLSPTPAPQWVNVCTPGDQQVFQNYDNFVIQAGACSDTCQVQLYKSTKDGYACTFKCETLQLYTAICRQCMMDWLDCQSNSCRAVCAGYSYSDGCASCTNSKCRDQFSKCTGMSGTSTAAGGGTGGANKPARIDKFPYGVVIGSAIGGIFGLAAVFFIVKRVRERGVTVAMTSGFEDRIFGKRASKPKGGADTGHPDSMEVNENPAYAHASRNFSEAGLTGAAVVGQMLRSRFSFHGTDDDEVDVPAGAAMTAIDANEEWYVVKVDVTGAVGVIPKSYVNQV